MKIWITRDRSGGDCYSWTTKPPCRNGVWEAEAHTNGSSMSSQAAMRIIGDAWQPNGHFCFEVEIGEVKRVRTREDVVRGLRTMLDHRPVGTKEFFVLCEAIDFIENPDSSDAGNRE